MLHLDLLLKVFICEGFPTCLDLVFPAVYTKYLVIEGSLASPWLLMRHNEVIKKSLSVYWTGEKIQYLSMPPNLPNFKAVGSPVEKEYLVLDKSLYPTLVQNSRDVA